MHLKGWRFLGVPMPRVLGPKVTTREWGQGGLYHFDVQVGVPIMGWPLVRYTGHLKVAATEA